MHAECSNYFGFCLFQWIKSCLNEATCNIHTQCQQRTLDRLHIAADLLYCFWREEYQYIKPIYEPPPGGCWVSGEPPVHQHFPVIFGWILRFNFITFWVWHTQADTQQLPFHLLHCLSHSFRCECNTYNQREQTISSAVQSRNGQYKIIVYCDIESPR